MTTPSTISYRRGDIVLVSFPFTDLELAKRRPALVVSPDIFNEFNEDLILLAVTSQLNSFPHSISVLPGDSARTKSFPCAAKARHAGGSRCRASDRDE